MTHELIMAAAVIIALLCMVTAMNIRLNKVVRELKDDFSVKTQMLQDELHVVYLRAVRDAKRKNLTKRKRKHALHGRATKGVPF